MLDLHCRLAFEVWLFPLLLQRSDSCVDDPSEETLVDVPVVTVENGFEEDDVASRVACDATNVGSENGDLSTGDTCTQEDQPADGIAPSTEYADQLAKEQQTMSLTGEDFFIPEPVNPSRSLNADRLNTLRMQWQYVKVLLIDEISLVGTSFLQTGFEMLRMDQSTSPNPSGGILVYVSTAWSLHFGISCTAMPQ